MVCAENSNQVRILTMGRTRHTERTKAKVLQIFRETGRVDLACAAVDCSRSTFYAWLKKSPAYRAEFETAWEAATGTLEDEAVRRGRDGVPEPVYSGGKRAIDFKVNEKGEIEYHPCAPCGGTGRELVDVTTLSDKDPKAVVSNRLCAKCNGSGRGEPIEIPAVIIRKSDQLLALVLRARQPKQYGNKIEATGKDGAPLLTLADLDRLRSPDEDATQP